MVTYLTEEATKSAAMNCFEIVKNQVSDGERFLRVKETRDVAWVFTEANFVYVSNFSMYVVSAPTPISSSRIVEKHSLLKVRDIRKQAWLFGADPNVVEILHEDGTTEKCVTGTFKPAVERILTMAKAATGKEPNKFLELSLV